MPLALGAEAERDFANIVTWTAEQFGARQAEAYTDLLLAAVETLARDPLGGATKARDNDIGAGFRSLHVARPGRHILLYRLEGERVLIVRILHDSMELSRHLPRQD